MYCTVVLVSTSIPVLKLVYYIYIIVGNCIQYEYMEYTLYGLQCTNLVKTRTESITVIVQSIEYGRK